jgi:hypothetical protein
VFVGPGGRIEEKALSAALNRRSIDSPKSETIPDPEHAFQAAKHYVEEKVNLWDWTNDVEFLALSWVRFI